MRRRLAPWWAVALAPWLMAGIPAPLGHQSSLTRPSPPIAGAVEGTFDRPPMPHWDRPAPGGTVNAARHTERGQPVIHGDRIYLGTAAGEALYALDRRSGALLVTYPAAGNVQAAPRIHEDRVFFGDTGGRIWAYSIDGEPLWSYDAAAPILVQPTLHGDLLLVASVDDLVLALNPDDGELVWRYQHRTDLARRSELALYAAPPPIVVEDEVLVGFSDGTLLALDRARGDARWQRRIGAGRYPDLVAAPVVADDDTRMVYVSGYYEPFAALDIREGRTVWSAPTGAADRSTLLVAQGRDLLVQPGTDGKLRAWDARTGDPNWTWDSRSSGALSAPVSTPAGIVVASTDKTVFLIDPESGDEVWRYVPDGGIDGVSVTPAVDGRQVVFITNAGRIVSLRAPRPPRGSDRDDGVRIPRRIGPVF